MFTSSILSPVFCPSSSPRSLASFSLSFFLLLFLLVLLSVTYPSLFSSVIPSSFFNLCSRLYPLALSVFRCLSFFRPSNLHFLYLQSVSVPFNLIFLSSIPPFPLFSSSFPPSLYFLVSSILFFFSLPPFYHLSFFSFVSPLVPFPFIFHPFSTNLPHPFVFYPIFPFFSSLFIPLYLYLHP